VTAAAAVCAGATDHPSPSQHLLWSAARGVVFKAGCGVRVCHAGAQVVMCDFDQDLATVDALLSRAKALQARMVRLAVHASWDGD
jgi:hypothetical protein